MYNIPIGTVLIFAPPTGIVIPKAIDKRIPDDRAEMGTNSQSFAKADPYFIYYEIAAAEVGQVQIGGLFDGLRVLLNRLKREVPFAASSSRPPFRPPFGSAFPM